MCNCKVCRFIRETEVLLCYSLVEITTKVVMFHKPEPLSDGRKLALGSRLDDQTAMTEIQARITVEGAVKRWAKVGHESVCPDRNITFRCPGVDGLVHLTDSLRWG